MLDRAPADFAINYDGYRIALAGAHRKPPPLLGAPALILHYGLWHPNCNENIWQKTIDHFLYVLYTVLRADGAASPKSVSPNYDYSKDTLYLFRHFVTEVSGVSSPTLTDLREITTQSRSVRYDVFSIRTTFRNVPLLVRAELYSEFWNIDFICDFDQIDASVVKDEKHPLYPYARDIHDIYEFVGARFSAHLGKDYAEATPEEKAHRLTEIRRTLHRRFHDLIKNDLLKTCFASLHSTKFLGEKFSEFHGVVLGLRARIPDSRIAAVTSGLSSVSSPRPAAGSDYTLEYIGVGNSQPEKRRTIQSQVGTCIFPQDVAVRVVDAMWPFIKEIQRSKDEDREDEKKYGKPEFTVTLMQDKRSIYISSLGWLDPHLESREIRPIVYTIVVSYHSRWALGRLVERIHSMGSFRLAALRDIEKITQAGDELRRIEEDLRVDEEKPAQQIDGDGYARKCLSVGSNIAYGLMHRVERSQYYVQEFERHRDNLRSHRVEGFQPYEQFVNRRMYGAFDYIARIGERYRELRQEIDLILRKNSLDSLRQVMLKIQGVQTHLENTSEETNDLLHSAEIIIAFPLVYYIGHFIGDTLFVTGGFLAEHVFGYPFKFEEIPSVVIGYLVALLFVGFGLAYLRGWRGRKKEERRAVQAQQRAAGEGLRR